MLQEKWNSVKAPKNDKQGKAVCDTMGFPVPEAIPGLHGVLSWAGTSKSIGWQLLWWESLASSLDRKHRLWNGLRDVQSPTPAASPGSELGMSSTAYICSGSFVYVLRICL